MSRLLTLCVLGALASCTPPSEPAQVPAPLLSLPEPPPPPDHGLPMVEFGSTWSPARAIAGDLEGLRDALSNAGAVTAWVEPRLISAGQGVATRRSLAQLAPKGTWAVEAKPWGDGVVGVPALRREPNAVTPRYAASGLSAQGITSTTVVVGDAPIDLTAWRALPAATAGSCQPAFDALALAQEQSLAYLEPFLDHADTVLRLQFRAELARVVESMRADVAPFESPTPAEGASVAESEAHACGHALFERVQDATTCLRGDVCPLAPRLVLRGGLAVAMTAPPWSPGDCSDRVPLGVEAQLQELATAATIATVSQLEPRWVTLADRVGAMGAVYEALDDVCSPRRRRFAAEDLTDARVRLQRVERALGSDVLDESGRWDVEVGAVFVPGSGPVVTLATFVPAEGGASQSAVAEAKGVRRFLLSRSLCRSGFSERPLAVAVFEPGAAEATFAGFLYEETLACADLPLPL